MDQLLTIKQVAEKLQVSEITIRRWLSNGTIAAIKLPQGIRFRPEWLENWLDKRTIKSIKQAS
jgi:excisionase family DNA binding protein